MQKNFFNIRFKDHVSPVENEMIPKYKIKDKQVPNGINFKQFLSYIFYNFGIISFSQFIMAQFANNILN